MLSILLSTLLAPPPAVACGNSMNRELVQLRPPVLVTMQSPTVHADSPEAVIWRRHTNQIRYCYERTLVQQPDLGALQLTAMVTVNPDGTVAEASWKDEEAAERSPSVSGCVQGRLVRMMYPASEQPRHIELTISLSQEPPRDG